MTDAKNLRLKDLDCLDNMLLQCFMSGINLEKYPRACIEYLTIMLDAGASPDANGRLNHPLSIVLTKLSAFPDVCVEATELFIRHGMDLTDLRPMYTAIQDKLPGVVVTLLEEGMSPYLHSYQPFNAIGVLNFAVSILSAYRRSPNRLADEGKLSIAEDIVKVLLEHGADPNYIDYEHKVCPTVFLPSDTATVELLLSYGAKVDVLDCDGNSLLCSFVKQNNIPVAELLLKNGADPNIRDELGRTPIFYVNDEAMLKLLLEHGAQADVAPALPDDDPLLLNIPEELIPAVVEAGADINLRDEDGRSVLYLCLKKIVADETFTRINILLEQGADPNLPDNTGDTPLQLFIRYYSYRYPNPLEIHERFPEKVLRLGESMIEHGGRIDPQDDSWKNFLKDNVKRPLTEYLLQLYEHTRMFGQVLDEDLEGYAR